MKTINVALNQKSIDDAIKELKKAQDQLKGQMLKEFIDRCCKWIVERANHYLDIGASKSGGNVIADIKNHWVIEQSTLSQNIFTIKNTSDKAVYVEFGVGIVGQESPHKMSGEVGYQYNIPTKYKYAGKHHDENTWRFVVSNKDDVDLLEGNYEEWPKKDGTIKIITRGSPSVMYAYNAVVDAKNMVASGGGVFAQYWAETLKKYWG
ncbi:MAG: hypothetical protein IKU25_05120 [Clostridia bacterium]|nr:hypothetical protein [Clostridia bacterium]